MSLYWKITRERQRIALASWSLFRLSQWRADYFLKQARATSPSFRLAFSIRIVNYSFVLRKQAGGIPSAPRLQNKNGLDHRLYSIGNVRRRSKFSLYHRAHRDPKQRDEYFLEWNSAAVARWFLLSCRETPMRGPQSGCNVPHGALNPPAGRTGSLQFSLYRLLNPFAERDGSKQPQSLCET